MLGVMAFLPLNELPALFPHVVDWISCLEKQAQDSGRALTPIEFNLAQHVGVAHPEKSVYFRPPGSLFQRIRALSS